MASEPLMLSDGRRVTQEAELLSGGCERRKHSSYSRSRRCEDDVDATRERLMRRDRGDVVDASCVLSKGVKVIAGADGLAELHRLFDHRHGCLALLFRSVHAFPHDRKRDLGHDGRFFCSENTADGSVDRWHGTCLARGKQTNQRVIGKSVKLAGRSEIYSDPSSYRPE